MDGERREQLEREIRALCDAGNHKAAATAAVRGYGPEILGFLHAVHNSETDASDAFAELCEVLWRKLPDFAWESTLRTWAYGIARNVSRALRRNAGRRRRREAPVGDSALEGVAAAVRTETLAHLRTSKRTRLQEIRDMLPEEDRMLLILRVDRKLEWNELARVLTESHRGGGAARRRGGDAGGGAPAEAVPATQGEAAGGRAQRRSDGLTSATEPPTAPGALAFSLSPSPQSDLASPGIGYSPPHKLMPLLKEAADALTDHIHRTWTKKECLLCGMNNWALHGYITLITADDCWAPRPAPPSSPVPPPSARCAGTRC